MGNAYTFVAVTDHAIRRYRKRIDGTTNRRGAMCALLAALEGGKKLYNQPDHRAVYAVHGDAWRIVVRHAPGRARAIITVLLAGELDDESIPLDLPSAREIIAQDEAFAAEAAAQAEAEKAAKKAETKAAQEQATLIRVEAHKAAQKENAAAMRAEALAAIEAKYGRRMDNALEHERLECAMKRSSWSLLCQCAPHLPAFLREAIEEEVPAEFRGNRGFNPTAEKSE